MCIVISDAFISRIKIRHGKRKQRKTKGGCVEHTGGVKTYGLHNKEIYQCSIKS